MDIVLGRFGQRAGGLLVVAGEQHRLLGILLLQRVQARRQVGAAAEQAGKARYLGASSMHAWQFAKANEVARRHGWTPFVSMQPELSLLYREEADRRPDGAAVFSGDLQLTHGELAARDVPVEQVPRPRPRLRRDRGRIRRS